MKLTATLAVIAILGCGAAFAADAPAASTAAPTKHATLKACNKQADAKKLTGADRKAFVKDCRAGKSSS